MTEEEDFLRELKNTFLEELEEILENIESSFLKFENNPDDKNILHEIFRYFHNIKGSSKAVGFNELSNLTHHAENMLSKLRNGEITPSDELVTCLLATLDVMREYLENRENPSDLLSHAETIKNLLIKFESNSFKNSDSENPINKELQVSSHQNKPMEPNQEIIPKNELFEVFGEQISNKSENKTAPNPTHENKTKTKNIIKPEESIKVPIVKINQLLDLFGEQVILQSGLDHAFEEDSIDLNHVNNSVSQLKKITQDLQYTMITLRMVTLESLFNRLERAARDVIKVTGKKVQLLKQGQTSELDKSIVDALTDPLTHMVRNAIDHGIEDPEKRALSGKDDQGTVCLFAHRSGGTFEIIIQDDGKGLDKNKILDKAKKLGIVKENCNLSDNQIFELIFSSGFSTIEQATEISGRGVGMDVVRQQIQKLKGICEISSVLGKGTRFVIRVPLSLAMFNGTVVSINKQRYVIPNSDFTEALILTNTDKDNKDVNLISVGERTMRVIDLRKKLLYPDCSNAEKDFNLKDTENLAIVVTQENYHYALLVNSIISQEQIVLKELGPEGKQIIGISGGTILGDGKVAFVLDIPLIIKRDQFLSSSKAI